jgi:hypothetical protein
LKCQSQLSSEVHLLNQMLCRSSGLISRLLANGLRPTKLECWRRRHYQTLYAARRVRELRQRFSGACQSWSAQGRSNWRKRLASHDPSLTSPIDAALLRSSQKGMP